MAQRVPASVSDLIAELSQLGDLRVWSVIITIFGDAVMPRGGVVPSSVLATLAGRMAIRPEALRVALHRLAKDGWITRARSGRNSLYTLTDRGRAEFLPATRRIYAETPRLSGPWTLAALPPATEAARDAQSAAMTGLGYVPLTPVLFLGTSASDKPLPSAIVVEGKLRTVPDWAREAIAPSPLQEEAAALENTLRRIEQISEVGIKADPEGTASLRILMIHQWRRLLLRHADVPLDVMPKDWRGEACRALVLSLHRRLSKAADPWLDAAIAPGGRGQPPG